MLATNHLTREETRFLQNVFNLEKNRETREIVLIFLLLNDGKTPQETADFLGCSKKKVNYWSNYTISNLFDMFYQKKLKQQHQEEINLEEIFEL